MKTVGLIGVLLISSLARADNNTAVFDLPLESLLQMPVSVASPFDERVVNTAAAVAVLQPEDWQRRGARSLEEALQQVPGVATYASLDSAPMIAVRGYANEISVRGMAILLDDVPLNNFSYASGLYDLPFVPLPLLTRVEMVRGAGSTTYGSDAFHGVLAMSTLQDDLQFDDGSMAASGGSFADGTLLARQRWNSADWQLQGGAAVTRQGPRHLSYEYHDPLTGQLQQGERQNEFLDQAGFLHLQTGDVHELSGYWRFSLYGDDYRSNAFPGVGAQFYPPLQAPLQLKSINLAADRDLGSQDSQLRMARLEYQHALADNLLLEARSYAWQGEQTWVFDFSRYPLSLPLAGKGTVPCRTSLQQTGVLPVFCPHTVYQGTADSRAGVSVLLRQQPETGTQWALGVGRDWLRVDRAFIRRVGVDGAVYLSNDTPFADVGRKVSYLFVQARSNLAQDRLSLVYGVRWDDYSDVGSATSPRLGVIWHFLPEYTLKLLYNHAFRAPSAAERYGSGAGSQQISNPEIRPEKMDLLELQLQWQFRQQDLELALFRSRWQDGIVLNPVNNVESQYQNTGLNRAHGLEFSDRWQWQQWQVEGNASWVFSDNARTGTVYSAFPRVVLNLGVGRQLGDNWQLWLNQRALLDQTLTDVLAQQPVVSAPDYWRTDLQVQRQWQDWRAWLDIRNLLNRRNVVSSLFNSEYGVPDEGLSARLGIERRW